MKNLFIILLSAFVMFSCGKSPSQKRYEAKQAKQPVVNQEKAKETIAKDTLDPNGFTETVQIDTIENGVKKTFYKNYNNGDAEEGYIIYSKQQLPVKSYKFSFSMDQDSQFLEEEYDELGNLVKRILIDFDFETRKLVLYDKSTNIRNYQKQTVNHKSETYNSSDKAVYILDTFEQGEGMVNDYLIDETGITEKGKKKGLDYRDCFKRITQEAFVHFERFLAIPVG